jgi:serine/threonine protein phosphatase PrpC
VQAEERERITAAGGFVALNRVNGSLAVSRALGDYDFKNPAHAPERQVVSAQPVCTGACLRRVCRCAAVRATPNGAPARWQCTSATLRTRR